MNLLQEVTTFFGGTVVLLGVVAWLAQRLVIGVQNKDLKAFEDRAKERLEELKSEMGKKANTELEQLRDRLQRGRDADTRVAEASQARNDRIRGEVLKWANPIFGAVGDLKSRLANILNEGAYPALWSARTGPVAPGWTISYDYFMPSTLFLFGTYFYWVQRLRDELSFELFESQTDKDDFLARTLAVSKALGDFPMKPKPCVGPDSQVFTLQQRVLGEALRVRTDGARCMGYDEFLEVWEEAPFAVHLSSLRALLEDLAENTCPWQRLNNVLAALEALDAHCRTVLGLPPLVPAPPAATVTAVS